MMERIYRGKSVDGEWHEGFLLRSPGAKQNRPGEGWYISAADEKPYAHLVKPMSVGMSTGLRDWNGQTVFEGDILKDVHCGKEVIFAVKYGEYSDYGIGHRGCLCYAGTACGNHRKAGRSTADCARKARPAQRLFRRRGGTQ